MYALMSIGMMLILGIMTVINMAHGEFYMLGGYFCYFLMTQVGIQLPGRIARVHGASCREWASYAKKSPSVPWSAGPGFPCF